MDTKCSCDERRQVIALALTFAVALTIAGCGGGGQSGSTGDAWDLDASEWGGGFRLGIRVSPMSKSGEALPPQHLVLDTGSSTLAFCNSELADKVQAKSTNLISCNVYGSAEAKEGYWGPFLQGDIDISGSSVKIPGCTFSIMQQEVSMPCGQGFDGIFGIAFKQLDVAASGSDPIQWSKGDVGSCPQPIEEVVGPVMQYLGSSSGVEKLGIYWSGDVGEGQGKMFIDGKATDNEHYIAENVVGKSKLGEFGWYDVNILEVSYGEQAWQVSGCNPQAGDCIMDTGTPVLVIPQQAYDALQQGQVGSLSVKLEAKEGDSPVTLSFDVQTLLNKQWVAPGQSIILGLPLRAFYYAVFDITDQSVEFVSMTSSLLARIAGEATPNTTSNTTKSQGTLNNTFADMVV